jgi:hypothetical protein
MHTESTITILFLAANPSDSTRLALADESREIAQRLRATPHGAQFRFEQEWAVRPEDLQSCLLRHKPDIVHFSGHGSSANQLIFHSSDGHSEPISKQAIGNLFRILRRNIRCVVLNACFSEEQAHEIAHYVDCVVGMSAEVKDTSAIAFAGAFYQALGFGENIQIAFDLGCNQVDLRMLTHTDVPRLIARHGVTPEDVRISRP